MGQYCGLMGTLYGNLWKQTREGTAGGVECIESSWRGIMYEPSFTPSKVEIHEPSPGGAEVKPRWIKWIMHFPPLPSNCPSASLPQKAARSLTFSVCSYSGWINLPSQEFFVSKKRVERISRTNSIVWNVLNGPKIDCKCGYFRL